MTRQLPDLRENRLPVLLVLLLLLGVNLAWLFLINVPRSQGLLSAEDRVQSLSRDVRQRGRWVEELGDAVERIRNREHTLKLFFEEVLADKARKMVPIQREIRAIALRHRIDPKKIGYSHSLVEDSEDMVRFKASFPLRGGYQALRSFIRDIEHSENFLVIDGIALSKSREGGALVALDIEVSTLFRDPELAEESRQQRGRP
jgi:hypothetical protein